MARPFIDQVGTNLKGKVPDPTPIWRWVQRYGPELQQRLRRHLKPTNQSWRVDETYLKGKGRWFACGLIAEIGANMAQFPSAQHLASWAGLCPGNDESAGKRHSGTTRKGNPWLRGVLCQAAWAASHTKDTYLSAQYRRLAARRGKKRAIIALAHSILVIHRQRRNI